MKYLLIAAALCCVSVPALARECSASHYGHGDGFHGKRTASGERMHKNDMTAAMRSPQPLGSHVRVTMVSTGRSVSVRINDRGPAAWTGKCIDLSYGAAQAIGMGGVGRVRIE